MTMWIIRSKTDKNDTIEVATEREAYDYCRDMGHNYYYEFLSQTDYMKRKARQWKREKSK